MIQMFQNWQASKVDTQCFPIKNDRRIFVNIRPTWNIGTENHIQYKSFLCINIEISTTIFGLNIITSQACDMFIC